MDNGKKYEIDTSCGYGPHSLEQQVFESVRRGGLLKDGDLVLAAVSGGADSVCLLLILKELEAVLGVRLEAVTVNHGIRGLDADADVEFVRELCLEQGIPVHVCRADVPEMVRREQLSEEEAARMARYGCFAQTAQKIGAQAVAVAHHRDDNCETILHHLFRGSSLRGLGGMAPVRKMGDLRIIRPLLQVSRREIECWLEKRGISWRLDKTNLEDDYTRNRIRCHVIPLIEQEINAQASAHVARAGGYFAEAQALMEDLAMEWLEQYGSLEDSVFRLPADALQGCRPVVRREILMQACRKVKGEAAFKDVGYVHLEMLERLAGGETSRKVELPGRMIARKEYGFLLFEDSERSITPSQQNTGQPKEQFLPDGKIVKVWNPELAKGISFKIFSYNGEKFPENNYTKWFDYDKIKDGLSLRTRQPGDYFLLDSGGRKKVKSYLIDRKIPVSQRDKILLLAEGSHVLWISDGRISAAYKVGRDTHYVLELYMEEEKLS